ncbi:MAG: hypothetical protein V3T02_03895 [Alphaproteobacteria bacterium]
MFVKLFQFAFFFSGTAIYSLWAQVTDKVFFHAIVAALVGFLFFMAGTFLLGIIARCLRKFAAYTESPDLGQRMVHIAGEIEQGAIRFNY